MVFTILVTLILLGDLCHSFVPNSNSIHLDASVLKLRNNKLFSSLKNDNNSNSDDDDDDDGRIISKEAQQLLARAKEIRESLEEEEITSSTTTMPGKSDKSINNNSIYINNKYTSPFNVPIDEKRKCDSIGYRLYVDIGREDGTWMEPRWGASGKRIECTIDVSFLLPSSPVSTDQDSSLANEEITGNMVKDNLSGTSSSVRILHSAPKARLRNGFDEMNVNGGGYRIDVGENKGQRMPSSNTARFYLDVNGTEEMTTFGDISIPKGCLYFSLPCFGSNVKNLSSKEGIVTVRQIGWHTGWRRVESRIIGVFRVVPIDKAKARDGF
jgi:hypothetical protein